MLQSVKKIGGDARPGGALHLRLIKPGTAGAAQIHRPTLREIYLHGFPRAALRKEAADWRRQNYRRLIRPAMQMWAAQRLGIAHAVTRLYLTLLRRDEAPLYLGLASMRLVTTAGVGYLVDSLQNLTEPENLKFHGFGTGTTAEAVGDTALVTELTTQYASDNTRPTGSLTEGASANIFRTVATLSPDTGGTIAVTEHGIFSQAATGGGTLLDRSVFSAVNLVAGSDSLQATYDLTISAGG